MLDGVVDVLIQPSESCESCGICSEGAGGLRLLEGVDDPLGVQVGDSVLVETPGAARRRAQVRLYLIPVAALVPGYLAGFLLSTRIGINPDVGGALCALLAGAVALATVPDKAAGPQDGPVVRAIIARGYSPDPAGDAGSQDSIPN
ncbi:MAG: SoxR reducing system RseC family protein [Actinomycetota bacterium]|nr:SoxR reducing system RseC family protein [Actinomycetota bacterium]